MDYLEAEKNYQVESNLLTFIFLLVLIVNAVVVADLFLSIFQSPLTMIVIRVVIMLTVLGFLAANGYRHPEIKGQGWSFLLSGFTLIFLGSFTAMLSRMPLTRGFFIYLGQPSVTFLDNIIFQLFGFFCLAYGFFLWIPSIIQAQRKMEQVALELELKVKERTQWLEQSNLQLYLSTLKLEEAIRLKNEFLASFSHELKTPLNSIMGFCRLLHEEHQGPLTARQQKSIEIIDNNSKLLLERINKILDYVKLEFEQITVDIQEIDLSELFEELTEIVDPLLGGKPINISLEQDKNLKKIRTDRKILSQLLLGLLDNAIKFTEKGSVHISAGLHHHHEYWWIAVSDTGQGISREDVPFIFEAFRQGDASLSKRYGGTGLGLTIVRKLTLLLGGAIKVDSTLGRGSTFTVSLPINPEKTLTQTSRSLTESPDQSQVPQS